MPGWICPPGLKFDTYFEYTLFQGARTGLKKTNRSHPEVLQESIIVHKDESFSSFLKPNHTRSCLATPYGAKQHQVSCLLCTIHSQLTLPLLAVRLQNIPSLLSSSGYIKTPSLHPQDGQKRHLQDIFASARFLSRRSLPLSPSLLDRRPAR